MGSIRLRRICHLAGRIAPVRREGQRFTVRLSRFPLKDRRHGNTILAIMPKANIAARFLSRQKSLLDAVGRGSEHLFGMQLCDSDARGYTEGIGALGEMSLLQLLASSFSNGQRIMKR